MQINKLIVVLILIALCTAGGCSSGSDTAPTPKDPIRVLWEEVLLCLEDTPWVKPYNNFFDQQVDLIMPEVEIVDLPCNLEVGGCLTQLFTAVPKSCVGKVQVWRNYTRETIVHEFYHSIHAQNHCGLIGYEGSIVDSGHISELYEQDFVCNQGDF